MELNINYLSIPEPMAKIDTTEINWTPIISVFTIVGGILSGFWIWVKFYFADKAKQREDFIEAFVTKVVDGKIGGQEKKFDDLWREMGDMRKTWETDVRHINDTMNKIYSEIAKK